MIKVFPNKKPFSLIMRRVFLFVIRCCCKIVLLASAYYDETPGSHFFKSIGLISRSSKE
jgi:hypothetical protein